MCVLIHLYQARYACLQLNLYADENFGSETNIGRGWYKWPNHVKILFCGRLVEKLFVNLTFWRDLHGYLRIPHP